MNAQIPQTKNNSLQTPRLQNAIGKVMEANKATKKFTTSKTLNNNNRRSSVQCYDDSNRGKQRTRNPNQICKINEVGYTCNIPTLFSMPDCIKSTNQPEYKIDEIIEKYGGLWEIYSEYATQFKQQQDESPIENPGSIQLFVLKYNELVRCFHDKVYNFTQGQLSRIIYNKPVTDIDILLPYTKPAAVRNTVARATNIFRNVTSSNTYLKDSDTNKITIAQYNAYLNVSLYASGIKTDYENIKKLSELMNNYINDISKIPTVIKVFIIDTSIGKIDTIKNPIKYPQIITSFNITGNSASFKSIIINTSSTDASKYSVVEKAQSIDELKKTNEQIESDLSSIIQLITKRMQTIRNNILIAFSLYRLYDKFFDFNDPKKLDNPSNNEPIALNKPNNTVPSTSAPDNNTNNEKTPLSTSDATANTTPSSSDTGNNKPTEPVNPSNDKPNKLKYSSAGEIISKIKNIFLHLLQMENIVNTIRTNLQIRSQNFEIGQDVLDKLNSYLPTTDINDEITTIEELYKKYIEEWWGNYKNFLPTYIEMIKKVNEDDVIPLKIAIDKMYTHFSEKTKGFIYKKSKDPQDATTSERAWSEWWETYAYETINTSETNKNILRYFQANFEIPQKIKRFKYKKNAYELYLQMKTADVFKEYQKDQDFDAKYANLDSIYKFVRLITDDGPGPFCAKNALTNAVGLGAKTASNLLSKAKNGVVDITSAAVIATMNKNNKFRDALKFAKYKREENSPSTTTKRLVWKPTGSTRPTGGKSRKIKHRLTAKMLNNRQNTSRRKKRIRNK